jgi:hypothetical protein
MEVEGSQLSHSHNLFPFQVEFNNQIGVTTNNIHGCTDLIIYLNLKHG